jgi:Ca2+-binding RTX toxin-like protein
VIITALAGNDEVTGKEADDVIYRNDGDDKLS